jgi:cytochrome P450
MGGICTHLSRDKELQNHLRTHPEDIAAAVEEFVSLSALNAWAAHLIFPQVRLYSPYRGFARTASREVEINGCPIKPTEPITMAR